MKAVVEIRDDRPPHRLIADVDGMQVDRVLSRTGRGAFAFTARRAGLQRDVLLEGRMVVIRSTEGLLPYVGVITQLEEDAAAGVVEVSGDNYASILYNAALDSSAPVSNQDAGTIAERLLVLAQGAGRSVFVEPGECVGTPLTIAAGELNFGAQTLGQALDALAGRVDDEWWLEHDVTRGRVRTYLYWRHRRGIVHDDYLQEGRDFTLATYKRDGLGAVRSAIAVGGGGPVGGRTSVAVTSTAGVTAGKAALLETAPVPPEVAGPLISRDLISMRPEDTDATVLAGAARRAWERPQTARETLALTCTVTAAAGFGPGDVVTARFHSLNYGGLTRQIRINAMQPDEETGECDLDVTL